MNIKIGFSYTNTLLSRAIRFLTRSKISHTFLLVGADVLEAGSTGFVRIPYIEWQKQNTLVYIIDPIVPLDKGVQCAEKWIGEPYAYGKLFGFIWVMIGRRLRRRWHNPIHERHALFCSEANTHVIQDSGWPGSEKLDPSATAPQDLLAFLSDNLCV